MIVPEAFLHIGHSQMQRIGRAHVVHTLVVSSVLLFIRLTDHTHTHTYDLVSSWGAVAALLILVLQILMCLTNVNFAEKSSQMSANNNSLTSPSDYSEIS